MKRFGVVRYLWASLVSAALAVTLVGTAAHAAEWSSSDRWGSWSNGGYTLYNNVWGSGYGPQTIWANSYSNWGVWADHPNTGGIKSYPNASRYVGQSIDSLDYVGSSFDVSVPGSGAYATAYDIWDSANRYETMLWMNQTGPVGPLGSYQTTASVGGHTWDVYNGSNGSNQVFSFVRTGDTSSGTVDILAILRWIQSRGWFGNITLGNVQFGYEITSASGGLDFVTNSYSVWYGGDGGSGGGTEYVRIRNRATGLYLDGMGRTGNGSNAGQWNDSGSSNQQWVIEDSGSYVRIRNRATGLYLDGMGRTSNGSDTGQWGDSNSYNQQWIEVTDGSYVRFRNRATGLYLDGMGRTGNGSNAGQWNDSGSSNQQWTIVAV